MSALWEALVVIVLALVGLAPGELPPPPGATTDPAGLAWRPAGDYYDPAGPVEFVPAPPEISDPLVVVPDPIPIGPLDAIPAWAVEMFDQLAECESGGDWSIDTGNGYQGGLQWHPGTWAGVRLDDYPLRARDATREQQIEAGWRLSREATNFRPWPACARRLGFPR